MKGPTDFWEGFASCPLVAILRGISPGEVLEVGDALVEAGFKLIEVPLNSPAPLDSISQLSRRHGTRAVVGAGTVLRVDEVAAVHAAGGRLIVSPNVNTAVIAASVTAGMASIPGYATVTEAFTAIEAGALVLKLFPGEGTNPAALQAQKAVLPATTPVLVVGGINVGSFGPWVQAGAAGFGLGSALYRPGMSAIDVGIVATQVVASWKEQHT